MSGSNISMTEINAQARAGEWLAALQRPERTPELESEFRAWLSAHPANRKAFDAATRIWERLGPACKAIRAQKQRRQKLVITAAAACLVVVLGAGAGVVSQSLKRRKPAAA